MISVEQASGMILSRAHRLGCETVQLSDGFGRVCAHDHKANLSQPPQAVSSMDGYALAVEGFAPDRPYIERCEIAAGHPWQGSLQAGECARIFTGAFIPKGADTVIIQENLAHTKKDGLYFDDTPKLGQWIRPQGMDFTKGQVLCSAGAVLNARRIGLLASGNIPWVEVVRSPRVAILTNGDELRLPGEAVQAGQIINSNALSLQAMLRMAGCVPILHPIVKDDAKSLINTAKQAVEGADFIISTGGASVGKHDLVQDTLRTIGLEVDFWKIAMRPGKPLIFGRLGQVPFFGLAGNPVSVAVCYRLFIWPFICALYGMNITHALKFERGILATALPANDLRESYWRARIVRNKDGLNHVAAFDAQDSAQQVNLSAADCLIRQPPHAPALKTGEGIDLLPFPTALHAF